MKKEVRYIQMAISICAIGFALIHIIWPEQKIDAITLSLFLIAIVPWLAPLIKTLKLPGGTEIQFQDLKDAKDRIEKAGLLSNEPLSDEYTFQNIVEDDPNLALAGLRIEIEKRLRLIASRRNIEVDKRTSIVRLLAVLSDRKIISSEERSVLADLNGLLNEAVHGANVNSSAALWAMDVGPKLLKSLDSK